MRLSAQRRAISLERAGSGCRILLTLLHFWLTAIHHAKQRTTIG